MFRHTAVGQLLSILFLTRFFEISKSSNCDFDSDLQTRKVIVTCTEVTFENKSLYNPVGNFYWDFNEKLIIQNSEIPLLPSDSTLSQFGNFNIFVFSSVHITEIQQNAFNLLVNLTQLHLSCNNIATISSGIFNNLKKIDILDLSNNSIKEISDDPFFESNIKTLNLSSNAIGDWRKSFFPGNLEVLDISHNDLSSFDVEQIPSTLKILNLSNNQIVEVVRNESKASKSLDLPTLDLSFNVFTDMKLLPLLNIKNLEALYLQKNHIISLPSGCFSDMIHLRFLNVSYNNLEVIHNGTFDALLYLETLDLSHNQLKTLMIDHTLHNIRLFIGNNRISSLNLTALTKYSNPLKFVALDGNNFTCKYLSEAIREMEASGTEVAAGEHFHSLNILGNFCFCYEQPEGIQEVLLHESDTFIIVSSVLLVVVVLLTLPWCVKCCRRWRSRESVLEHVELI